jgi:hypothetical protein
MSESFSQSITFTLDKAHFIECFEQSAPAIQAKDFRKAIFIGLLGVALMFIKSDDYYIAYFLIALGIIEVFSVQYRKAWWVWRQLLSKAANSKVKLIINEQGITTESLHINNEILWRDIIAINKTKLGLLLSHKAGVNYISNSVINEKIRQFILQQKPTV